MDSFTRLFALCFIVLLLTIAAAGIIVDPGGFFYYRGIYLGDKLSKNFFAPPLSAKPLILPALKPRVVVIGTSRVGRGYDLGTIDATDLPDNRYNLGIPGMTMAEAELLIEALNSNQYITDIFLALDYGMFTRSRPVRQEFIRMKAGNKRGNSSIMENLRLYKTALFSPAMIKSLIIKGKVSTDLSGFLSRDDHILYKTLGHRKITRRTEEAKATRDLQQSSYARQLKSFKHVITLLADMPATIHIFVNPVHIRKLIVSAETGQKKSYLTWLNDTIQIMCEQEILHSPPILTVFSGVNPITTEPFPAMGDTDSSMRWYWESSHFKPAVGTMVLQQLIAPKDSSDDFGEVLTCRNRSQFIAGFEKKWNGYMVANPDIVEEIAGIVKRTRIHQTIDQQRGRTQ